MLAIQLQSTFSFFQVNGYQLIRKNNWTCKWLYCVVGLAFLSMIPSSVSAQPTTDSSEIFYAGMSLGDLQKQLTDGNPVVRRQASISLLPFASLGGSDTDAVLLQGLNSQDPAVVYWTCEVCTQLKDPADSIKMRIGELINETRSRGARLAIAFADFHLNHNDQSLDYLLEVLEQPRTGKTFVDTKQMAFASAGADFVARLGASRIGDRTSEVLRRLQNVSQNVNADLKTGKFHGQIYHTQKACDRAIAILKQPEIETDLKYLAPPVDAVEGVAGDDQAAGNRAAGNRAATRGATDESEIWQPRDPKSLAGGDWERTGRPNILWISCEDISANLGCYGDTYASTPNLDQLAKDGIRFTNAFTHAGVCAVLRSGVITGRYPISIGTQHMRSFRPQLTDSPCFPELMRKAGYFCTNNSKTDYQFQHSPQTWDREGSKHSDWRERKGSQPFFSVVNLTISHESQIRHGANRHQSILKNLDPSQRHDPVKAAEYLPPYFPDSPETRQDWAWYSDNISEMDRQVGEILMRLESDGLADSTVVVFWSDHGQGLPRGKRWLYDSGTHVPMIVRFPNRWDAGRIRDDLVTLLDLAPTMLSMTDVPIPDNMDGRVLWGEGTEPEPRELFFHRDRMDETYDLIRSIRTREFRYVRNYQPQRTYAQYLEYMELMPTMKVWREQFREGKLTPTAARWFGFKPVEELYDVASDPFEIHNLAAQPEYRAILQSMRKDLAQWQVAENDWGMTPEVIMLDELWPDSAAEPDTKRSEN